MPSEVPPIVANSKDTILALDPGKVTGLAMIQPHQPDILFTTELEVEEVVRTFQLIRDHVGPSHLEVVMENFIIGERTLKTARSLDALDLIGFVKLSCLITGIKFTLQTPTQAKKFATDDKLKAVEWYEPTKDGHKNDAARHLLVYMIHKHPDFASENIIPRLASMILHD